MNTQEQAPAKINLALDILGRRPDGYHELCTIMHAIDLCDTVSLEPAKEISVYDYTQVIFAAIWGFFFFGQIPDIWSILGYVIIIGAAFYRRFRA